MPLMHLKDLLEHARHEGYAVGAYGIDGLEVLEAVIAGCEADRAPAILSLAESSFADGRFDTLMPAVVGAARRAAVPLAIHLAHGTSLEAVVRAIRLGCTAATLDASPLPFEANVELTRQAVELAHGCGLPLEGVLPAAAGMDAARRFVAQTGVDCLALTVRSEAPAQSDPVIDKTLGLPLAVQGDTNLGEAEYRPLIAGGVAKVDCRTALSAAAAASIREQAARQPQAGYAWLMRGVRAAVQAEVGRMNRVLGAEGRALEAMAACRPWQEVEHAIAFNFDASLGEEEVAAMLARGREQLLRVPGVRRVDSGEALTEGARYRLFWDIRFASEAVVETYWRHPEHVDYADNVFRPYAGDRLKIDFRLLP